MTLTVATHNLPGRVGPAAQRETLVRLAEQADVIALQEAGWLNRHPDRVPPGMTVACGTDAALPILHRSTLTVTGQMERRAYEDTDVGSWGAGPKTLKAGWDYGIRLRAETDCWVFNAHLAPSVTQARPTDPEDGKNWDTRRRLFRGEVAQLVNITSWIHTEPVMICGDFNATPSFALLAPLEDRFDLVTRPSHGVREIDHIWYRRAKAAKVWEVRTPSDHDAVLATFVF